MIPDVFTSHVGSATVSWLSPTVTTESCHCANFCHDNPNHHVPTVITSVFYNSNHLQKNNIITSSDSHTFIQPQIAKFMGPTWGPPGSCRPQMGPMLAQWTLLSETHTAISANSEDPIKFFMVDVLMLCYHYWISPVDFTVWKAESTVTAICHGHLNRCNFQMTATFWASHFIVTCDLENKSEHMDHFI